MSGPSDNPYCTQCPGRCSYGTHIHMFEMTISVKDEERMKTLQTKLDQDLRGCKT